MMALVLAGGAVSVFLATIEARHVGVLADLALGAFMFAAQYCALFARRARVTLTKDALVIVNALSAPRTRSRGDHRDRGRTAWADVLTP